MSDVATSLVLLAAQVTGVTIVALILDTLLARRSPNAAGRVLFIAILALPLLTAAIFCPLPQWWAWQDSAKVNLPTPSIADSQSNAESPSEISNPIVGEQADHSIPLLKLLRTIPAVGARWQPSPRSGRILALLWLAGVCICAVRILGGLWSVSRLRGKSKPIMDDAAIDRVAGDRHSRIAGDDGLASADRLLAAKLEVMGRSRAAIRAGP